MRRRLVTLGTLLLLLPPVVVLALAFIPFDVKVTRSFYILTPGPVAVL